jgi:hypothetical protein
LMRQMPPSNACTIRSNPGHAEGRTTFEVLFKGAPGTREKPLQGVRRGIMPALAEGMKSLPVGIVLYEDFSCRPG